MRNGTINLMLHFAFATYLFNRNTKTDKVFLNHISSYVDVPLEELLLLGFCFLALLLHPPKPHLIAVHFFVSSTVLIILGVKERNIMVGFYLTNYIVAYLGIIHPQNDVNVDNTFLILADQVPPGVYRALRQQLLRTESGRRDLVRALSSPLIRVIEEHAVAAREPAPDQ